ncbi:MAG: hypothetical protein Fur0023_21560 [Bacteroidia bacterium]
MKKLSFVVILTILATTVYPQVFTLVDSIQFTNAQIWGVCSDEGDSLCVTTTFNPSTKPHIFMRKVNYTNISGQSTIKQLTFDSDFMSISNLTDHKSIILNNQLYVAFSTQGDQDLFLFKTDINGNRIGSIVTVVTGSPDPTNDMILTTDGTYIYVLHFDPPSQHHVYRFDQNLNQIGSSFSTTTLNHNNIGNAIFTGNYFHMFTGNMFGFNSNLTYTKWDNTWAPASSQSIVNSLSGDGNWFATGVVFDNSNMRWYIAMNHIQNGQAIGQEHIDLLAFDTSFNLIERLHVTSTNYTRPHFVLKGGYLYMTYDRPGVGVYLHKYQIQNTTGIMSEVNCCDFSIFPNPFSSSTTLQMSRNLKDATLSVYNLYGQQVKQVKNIYGQTITLSRTNIPSGLYFIRLTQDSEVIATKKVVITD